MWKCQRSLLEAQRHITIERILSGVIRHPEGEHDGVVGYSVNPKPARFRATGHAKPVVLSKRAEFKRKHRARLLRADCLVPPMRDEFKSKPRARLPSDDCSVVPTHEAFCFGTFQICCILFECVSQDDQLL